MNYRDMSVEGIEALIGELRDILREKRGEPTKATLSQILKQFGNDSDDFFGTGLTMQEHFVSESLRRLKLGYAMQERPEQKRRIGFVIRLSAEYQRIVEKTIQSTAWCVAAIEEVLSGDWEGLRISREALTFTGEDPRFADHYFPFFAEFVKIIDEVLQTVPVEPKQASVSH